jgi:zinc protease
MSIATPPPSPAMPRIVVDAAPALPIVHVVIAGQGGALLEPASHAGLASFHARMLRRGAGDFDAAAFEAELDRLGAELWLDAQASTFAIHGTVLRRNLHAFVKLLGVLCARPRFEAEEIERLKREIEAQRVEVLDSDDTLARLAFRRTMLAGHPYGRPLGGTAETVARIDEAALHAHHARAFPRAGMTFGFAGAITRAEAEAITAQLLEAMPRTPEEPSLVIAPTPPLAGRGLVLVDKPERTQTQMLLGTRGSLPSDADHVALSVGVAVLGGTFTSRIVREIRSKRGWSYSTSARISVERIRTSLVLSAQPGVGDAGPCLALMRTLLEEWVAKGVTARELSGVRKYLIRSSVFDRDTAQKRMQRAVDEHVLDLGTGYYDRWLAGVEAVSLEEVNAAIAHRIDPAACRAVAVCTASDLRAGLEGALPGLAATRVVPAEAIARGTADDLAI